MVRISRSDTSCGWGRTSRPITCALLAPRTPRKNWPAGHSPAPQNHTRENSQTCPQPVVGLHRRQRTAHRPGLLRIGERQSRDEVRRIDKDSFATFRIESASESASRVRAAHNLFGLSGLAKLGIILANSNVEGSTPSPALMNFDDAVRLLIPNDTDLD